MYLNTFINLEENINGYGRSGKSPTGHAIICMPGMVRVYLQNLRDLQGKEYICYGLSKKDNKAIRLGAINLPSENKMTNFKIDIENIQGKGVKANNIDCIAIVVEGDTVGNTDTVMLGYVNDKYLIAPILENGLPKKEVKIEPKEIRKDKTPTSIQTPKKTKTLSKAEEQKALNINVETPIQSEEAIAIESSKTAEEIKKEQEALNTNVETPIQLEEAMNIGNEEGPDPVMPNPPIEECPKKVPCSCKKKDLGKQIKEIIEGLRVEDNEVNNLQQNIQLKLNELMSQGVSKDEILTKKVELEEQIKDLVLNKLHTNLKEEISTRNKEEEYPIQDQEIENKIRNILGSQFDLENVLDRGCKYCNSSVDTTLDEDVKLYGKNKEAEKNKAVNNKETGITADNDKEESDFLEQLEIKLKGLQKLLKTTIGTDSSKGKEIPKTETKVAENKVSPTTQEGTTKKKEEVMESTKPDCINNSEDRREEYDRVREIFETSASITPFEKEGQPVDWVRISLAELISIPQLSYDWATQPFITFSYHKFNHLILGKDRDVEQYYIGIPDIYEQTRSNILEIDKIERFICRNNNRLTTGEAGYWIAMI